MGEILILLIILVAALAMTAFKLKNQFQGGSCGNCGCSGKDKFTAFKPGRGKNATTTKHL